LYWGLRTPLQMLWQCKDPQKPIFHTIWSLACVLHPKYHVQAIFTSASRLLALKVVMGLKALNNAPNKIFAWFPLSPSSES
jgi:hypothetical protein